MNNLIILIVTLGLGAVMSAGGIYYGSEAVQNLRAKAEAAQIIAQGQALADAWTEFARANNGNPTLTDYAWGDGSDDLDGKYINAQPMPPSRATATNLNFYYPANFKNSNAASCSGGSYQAQTTPADTIILQLKNIAVCRYIAAAAGGTPTQLITTSGNLTITATNARRPYDCLWLDQDGVSGMTPNDAFLFIYRVFDLNNFTTTTSTC